MMSEKSDDKKPDPLFDLINFEHQKKLKDDTSKIKFDSYWSSNVTDFQTNHLDPVILLIACTMLKTFALRFYFLSNQIC